MSKTNNNAANQLPSLPKKLTEEKKRELELKLDCARWFLIKQCDEPDLIFYSQLAMGLRDVVCESVPTARTNGKVIKWGADFLDKLTDEEVRGTLVHEVLHPAWGHLWRFDMKDRKIGRKANIACDYVINIVIDKLAKKGIGIKLPDGILLDYQYDNMAEEEIFNKLPDPPPSYEFGFGDFEASPEDGDGKDGNDSQNGKDGKDGNSSGGSKDSLRDEWERRIISAAQAAKALGQGNLPANLQRIIDERCAQRIDWRNEMADFVRNIISTRNDWTRSSRKNSFMPVIMPRKKIDSFSTILAARDTSGSITDEILGSFNCLLESLVAEMGCQLILVDCDADIQEIYRLEKGCVLPSIAKGGGGTDFRPVFNLIEKLKEEGEDIAGIVYLTDLMGTHVDVSPEIPTLWLSTTKDSQAPFGRTIFVEI